MRGLATFFLAAVALAAGAQDYPQRPVRLVLGFAPGGAPDSVARVLGQQLTAQLGQSFVLDSRPGANGIIGTDLIAKGAPDGYTLLVASASFAVNPAIYRKLPFDPMRDFAPVTNICISEGLLLVVNQGFPAQAVQELIALAKKPGAKFAYGSSGIGNVLHLAGALFSARTGTPKPIIDRLHAAFSAATVAATEGLIKAGYEINNQTPEESARSIADQAKLFADLARNVGLKPE